MAVETSAAGTARVTAGAEPGRARRLLRTLGPGLISGAADDDPCAIAAYSQAGARFGYGLCWLLPLVYPLMVAVQQVSARLGRTTGRGLAGVMRRHCPGWLVHAVVLPLVLANTVAIAANLGAMADALRLLVGGPHLLYVLLFGAFCVAAQVLTRYPRYVQILKWTTLSLLAYVAAALLADVRWGEVGRAMLRPPLSFGRDYLAAAVAIFGVALSPYLFFWQASQEAEDQRIKPDREPLARAPGQARGAHERIRLDTLAGMGVAVLVGFAITVTAAATLHANGVTEVATSAQAAEALRPAAGPLAFAFFALGVIGTGLLAVPVLAGSAAYALGEARGWPVGLARRPMEAKAFYATLAAATLAGVAANLAGLDPMQALFWGALVNGVVAAPVLAVMTWLASRPAVMGDLAVGGWLRLGGWLAATVVGLSVVATGVAALTTAGAG